MPAGAQRPGRRGEQGRGAAHPLRPGHGDASRAHGLQTKVPPGTDLCTCATTRPGAGLVASGRRDRSRPRGKPTTAREELMDIPPLRAPRADGPEPPAAAELAGYVVAAAVWAPSVHNTQPWWFSAD